VNPQVIAAIISGILTILLFLFSPRKRSIHSRIILAFLLLSVFTDLGNSYLWERRENNLHLINIYEYLAIVVEIGFMLCVVKFKKGFVLVTSFLVLTYLLLHGIYNYKYGFSEASSILSFIFSLMVCIYASIVSFRILSGSLEQFNKSKFLLIPVLGYFIFEASCLIPVCMFSIDLNKEDEKFLFDFYNVVMGIGSILRNILFAVYFIIERKNQLNRQSLNISIDQ
jgi:hypothetical protein